MRDLWHPDPNRRVSHREMISYIRRLPSGCELDKDQRGEPADWSLTDYLLRAVANAVVAGNYQRGGKRPPASAFIPEPRNRGRRPQAVAGTAARDTEEKPKGINELNALFDQAEGREHRG